MWEFCSLRTVKIYGISTRMTLVSFKMTEFWLKTEQYHAWLLTAAFELNTTMWCKTKRIQTFDNRGDIWLLLSNRSITPHVATPLTDVATPFLQVGNVTLLWAGLLWVGLLWTRLCRWINELIFSTLASVITFKSANEIRYPQLCVLLFGYQG